MKQNSKQKGKKISQTQKNSTSSPKTQSTNKPGYIPILHTKIGPFIEPYVYNLNEQLSYGFSIWLEKRQTTLGFKLIRAGTFTLSAFIAIFWPIKHLGINAFICLLGWFIFSICKKPLPRILILSIVMLSITQLFEISQILTNYLSIKRLP